MLSQKPNHTGHTMEDTGTERGQLTLSPRPSLTTLVVTTVAGMAGGLPMLSQKPSHTGLITEDTGMERGQLTQSQRLSHTTLADTTVAIMARGLLMLSQKQSPKLSLTTGAILMAGLTGD